MRRRDLVVAGMAAAPGPWTPVQVQKFFFVLDRQLSRNVVGAPLFNFEPYDYGPFDPAVYREIESLELQGRAVVDRPSFAMKSYSLTSVGQQEGEAALKSLPAGVRDYLRKLARWIKSLTFAQLVTAIYAEFPEMKVRSVFREP